MFKTEHEKKRKGTDQTKHFRKSINNLVSMVNYLRNINDWKYLYLLFPLDVGAGKTRHIFS